MTAPARLLLIASVAAVSFGASGAAHAQAQTQPQAAPQSASAKKISVEFRGNLRDALRKIASEGGINLVVTGDLSRDSEVYLHDVTAEEALRTVAQAYDLRIQQSGSIWTLRPMTKAELAAPEAPKPSEPAAAVPPVPVPPAPNAPAAAPPPAPNIQPGMSEDAVEQAMRSAEEYADKTEEQANQLAEKADEQAEKAKEAASAQRDEARARAEELREQARQARENAREARERAKEIERKARDAIRQATRNMDKLPAVGAGAVEVKEGEVVDDAVAYGGPLKIYGHVQGDAVSLGGDVTLGPKSWVEGDVVAMGGSIHRDEGAVVDGEVQSLGGAVIGQAVKESVKELRGKHPADHGHHDESSGIALFLVWFMVLFGVGFVTNLFAPNRMKLVQEEIRRKPLKSGLLGFLGAIALAPLSILLMITLIGIPLAILVLWPAALLAYAIGFTAVASEIGLRLPFFRGRKTQALVLAIGLLLLLVVAQIPVLGPLAVVMLGFIGFGAIISTRFGFGRTPPGPVAPSDIPTGVPV